MRAKIISLLVKETKLKKAEVETLLSIPPDSKLGDYAFPCFKLGKNAAAELKDKIKLPSFLSKIETAGPYLNFFLNPKILAKETLTNIDTKHKKEKKNIVIEYCGPNTNKPLHLGHLRNMALGSSICKILSYLGNDVHPVNIVNDRGIHISQSMLAYKKWGKEKKPDKKSDHFVGDYYVLFSQKAKENEKLKEEAQKLLQKWEDGDKEVHKLWKQMNKWVLDGFKETYKRFGVKFEKEYFESEIYEEGKKLVAEGLRKKVFQKNEEGAVIAKLEDEHLPDKVVLRSDGTSIYITQDLYLAEQRFKDFKFDQMLYVVASEQNNHFKQLFAILKKLGKKYAHNLYHLSYGLVHLPSGRMKSREGTVVDADDLIDEISTLAAAEIRKRHKLSATELFNRAENISLSAIKFFMLKNDPLKDMIFNPEESLSFEGETGPYLQYTHARACSILRKADFKINLKVDYSLFGTEGISVIKLLSQFNEVVEKCARTFKPHHLAQYLIALGQSFNEFYHQCQVISEDKKIMSARLLLVDSVRKTLAKGLNLLGVEALEEM